MRVFLETGMPPAIGKEFQELADRHFLREVAFSFHQPYSLDREESFFPVPPFTIQPYHICNTGEDHRMWTRSPRERWFFASMGAFIIVYVTLPLLTMFTGADWKIVLETASDPVVIDALWRSVWTAAAATAVIAFFGTPLAYVLARHSFRWKAIIEAMIDLPIMVPHTVAGIAILMTISPKAPVGAALESLGFSPVNSNLGIVIACIFVSIPFYVDATRDAFAAVSPRLEKVSRNLGASFGYTFFHVTLPLARRGILSGLIMSWARAVSEFGAIVIISYHPMVAPVLIYDRFATFGLKYSSPIAVHLILISLVMFILLRVFAVGESLLRRNGTNDQS